MDNKIDQESNDINIESNDINIESNDINIESNNINIESNNINIESNNINIESNNINIESNNINIESNNTNIGPKFLQFASDIHLEFWKIKKDNFPKIEPIEPGKSYLALIGDIGYPHMINTVDFLRYHSEKFEHIFWIAGNHEYYSSKNKQYSMEEIEQKITEVCSQFKNVTFLQKSTFLVGKTLFVGCTLWTDVSKCSSLSSTMNDYNNVYTSSPFSHHRILTQYNGVRLIKKKFNRGKKQIDPTHIFTINESMREWIFEMVENNTDKRIIVLTHRAPSTKMLEEVDKWSGFYANDLDEEISKHTNINYWLSGHTHVSKEIIIGSTTFISNCIGYKTSLNKNFKSDKYICFE